MIYYSGGDTLFIKERGFIVLLTQEESKKKRAVLYITSTTAIRETFQACEEVKAVRYFIYELNLYFFKEYNRYKYLMVVISHSLKNFCWLCVYVSWLLRGRKNCICILNFCALLIMQFDLTKFSFFALKRYFIIYVFASNYEILHWIVRFVSNFLWQQFK